MLYDEVITLYKKLRLMHYRELFGRIREKDGSLSATEAFAADTVYLLGNPTLSQFAQALGVSQPNATYKANNLVAKGYIKKTLSPDDKRECRLMAADKFYSYYDTQCEFISKTLDKLRNQFSDTELEVFEKMLHALNASAGRGETENDDRT